MMIACFLEIILVHSSPRADPRRGCRCSFLVSRSYKTLDVTHWSDGRSLRQVPLTSEDPRQRRAILSSSNLQLRTLTERRGIRQKVEGDSPSVGRGQNAEMSCAQDRVILSLADQIQLVGPLESRALGEVVRIAVAVLGGHRGKDAVLPRKVDKARVRVADHEDARGPVCLAAAIELAKQRRVGRAVLLTHGAVGSDPAERRGRKVVEG